MKVTEQVTPQGRVDLSLLGVEYAIRGEDIKKLRDALQVAIEGGIVLFRLERDARLPKPVAKGCFRFVTSRGTERVSKAEQKTLLRLCVEADAGRVVYWPARFTTTFLGTEVTK
jgi:hypothetical protein